MNYAEPHNAPDKDRNYCGRYLLTKILVSGASARYLSELVREHNVDGVCVIRDYDHVRTSDSDAYMSLSPTIGYYEGVRRFVDRHFPGEPDENIAVAMSVHEDGAAGLACVVGLRDSVTKLVRLSAKKLITQPDEP